VDWIVTGASRGIGRALVRAMAAAATQGDRIFALARDAERLGSLATSADRRCPIITLAGDLSQVVSARELGRKLAEQVEPGATLIHNAGHWPSERRLVDGLEAAFVTNCLGPLVLQAPLLQTERLDRVLVVSAGLLVKGRFDASRTPTGDDFSVFRTYCTTKLAGAVAMRDVARRYPAIDFAIVHPGVVNTDLGARRGLLGWILELVKRKWESPDTCAARLMRLLQLPRWQRVQGEAPWYFEESQQPWPPEVDRDREAVLAAVSRLLVVS
jgi:NAD(P)-dependent dehydrogenase (short-subunit alcohol dehydrogenase family)